MPVEKDPKAHWIDKESAARRAQVSAKTIDRWLTDQKIAGELVNGRMLIDPLSLPDDTNSVEGSVRVLTAALREAHDHITKSNGTVLDVYRLLSDDHVKIGARTAELQKQIDDQRELVNKMQSDELARDMQRREHEQKMKRGEEAYRKFMEYLPPLADALAHRLAPGSRAIQEKHLSDMIEQLPDEAIQALKVSGYLSDVQVIGLVEIRKRLKDQRSKIDEKKEEQAAE